MQPIVAKYTDKNGIDFVDQGCLIPDYPVASQENNPSAWVAIGDSTDYLLAKAISLITGQTIMRSLPLSTRSMPSIKMKDAGLSSPKEERIRQSVNLDHIPFTPADLRKLRETKN